MTGATGSIDSVAILDENGNIIVEKNYKSSNVVSKVGFYSQMIADIMYTTGHTLTLATHYTTCSI